MMIRSIHKRHFYLFITSLGVMFVLDDDSINPNDPFFANLLSPSRNIGFHSLILVLIDQECYLHIDRYRCEGSLQVIGLQPNGGIFMLNHRKESVDMIRGSRLQPYGGFLHSITTHKPMINLGRLYFSINPFRWTLTVEEKTKP